jgi:hypothetical protein
MPARHRNMVRSVCGGTKVTSWLRHTAGCSFKDKDEGKFLLIDLEAYSESHGDRAQAQAA